PLESDDLPGLCGYRRAEPRAFDRAIDAELSARDAGEDRQVAGRHAAPAARNTALVLALHRGDAAFARVDEGIADGCPVGQVAALEIPVREQRRRRGGVRGGRHGRRRGRGRWRDALAALALLSGSAVGVGLTLLPGIDDAVSTGVDDALAALTLRTRFAV